MAYKTIDETFWTDPKVRALNHKERFLFLYLITNPHNHYSGIYYLPKSVVAEETGLTLKDVKASFEALAGDFIRYDSLLQVVWVIHMARHQIKQGKRTNLVKGIAAHLSTLHGSVLIREFLKAYSYLDIPFENPSGWDTRPIAESVSVEPERIEDKEKDAGPQPPLYGEFKSVRLSCEEYEKLVSRFGEARAGELIENLSSGVASKGYRYRPHYAAILSWERKDRRFPGAGAKKTPEELDDERRRIMEDG